jgi:hypothetical protein
MLDDYVWSESGRVTSEHSAEIKQKTPLLFYAMKDFA